MNPINIRLANLYRIGVGPSSSHTVGPMRAAAFARAELIGHGGVPRSLRVELKGSLGATGRGHHSDLAVLAGLHGWEPHDCDIDAVLALRETLAADPSVAWSGGARVRLHPDDVVFLRARDTKGEVLPHPNTMVFHATFDDGSTTSSTWCSIGGGFIRRPEEVAGGDDGPGKPRDVPHPFNDAESLMERAREIGGTLGDVVLANERALADDDGSSADAHLDAVWETFLSCIERGTTTTGELPGGLAVQRRARLLLDRIDEGEVSEAYADIARAQAYAFAVQEENAAGGRVVTAPTNGAAGIVPAVLVEAADRRGHSREEIHAALATAAAIAMLVKTHASISGAEVGCQGEVGTATSMAAAALCQLMGGTIDQVANAAEIGMEHNLGLTCDPIKGLVQAPCIERNAMGVAKAHSAAQLALRRRLDLGRRGAGCHLQARREAALGARRIRGRSKRQRRSRSRSWSRRWCWSRSRSGSWLRRARRQPLRHALRPRFPPVAELAAHSLHLLVECRVVLCLRAVECVPEARPQHQAQPALRLVALLHQQRNHVHVLLVRVVRLQAAVPRLLVELADGVQHYLSVVDGVAHGVHN